MKKFKKIQHELFEATESEILDILAIFTQHPKRQSVFLFLTRNSLITYCKCVPIR